MWVFRKGRGEITCLIWVKGLIVGPDFTHVMLRGWVYSSYTCDVIYDDELGENPEHNLNALAIAERGALLSELEDMHWNISRVAKKLDLSRNTLYRRMKRFGINPPR
ncbi:MAG: helix-turn-helix domain-containing protein [Candidatus Thiodiazotropha sp.]